MLQIAFVVLWLLVLGATDVAAITRGTATERAGAMVLTTGWLISVLVVQLSQNWAGLNIGLFAVDALALFGFLTIGLCSNKIWPLLACGFQLCGVGLHAVYWLQPHIWSAAYFFGLQTTSCAVLAALTAGVINTWKIKPAGIEHVIENNP